MADQLIIDNPQLLEQLQQIADQEKRSVEDVLGTMVAQYQPRPIRDDLPDPDEWARFVHLDAYRRAREYWHEHGDLEKAAMTDDEMDEKFWLFDAEGIPRLKSEKDQVVFPEGSLHIGGKILASSGFRSGYTDISARSREILNNEYADYILSRRDEFPDDGSDQTSA